MVELDVRRTKDHQLVLGHDRYLHGQHNKLKIHLHTLAELQHLTLPGGETIPAPTAPNSLSKIEPIIDEVVVEAAQPRYVAPTLRDSIGRIWAPVLINGKGPLRLVLDTGATRSALLPRVARALQIPMQASTMRVHGVTGSSDVSTVDVQQLTAGVAQE